MVSFWTSCRDWGLKAPFHSGSTPPLAAHSSWGVCVSLIAAPLWDIAGLNSLLPLLTPVWSCWEVIWPFGIWYHQYADATQWYIVTLGCAGDVVEVLSQCLEAVRIWIRENSLKLNPSKTELLFVHWSSSVTSCLASGWAASLQEEQIRNWGILLGSSFWISKWRSWPGRSLPSFSWGTSCSLTSDRRIWLYALIAIQLDYCNTSYMGLPWKTIQKVQLVYHNL